MDTNINVRERRDALIARREENRSRSWQHRLTTIKWPGMRKVSRVRRER
jgi:hypothetical protein